MNTLVFAGSVVPLRVLVACEETQEVTKALRRRGHEAFSCDVLECSGGHPEWHLKQDVLPLLEEDWDMILAFPPCTDLAASGARWFAEKRKSGAQQRSIEFFMAFAEAPCERIAIENPVGIMSTRWRKPDQIVQPWWFGDEATKTTCLWLKGLPKLKPTKVVGRGERHVTKSGRSLPAWYNIPPTVKDRAKIRSQTFPGFAEAMADQWADVVSRDPGR